MNRLLLCAFVVFLLVVGCGGDENEGIDPGDTTPPDPVQNLIVTSPPGRLVTLAWSAPGEHGAPNQGQASSYSIRYSPVPLTEERWDSATVVAHPPVPKPGGQLERFDVTGLPLGNWHFALKAADDVPNWSALSNGVSATVADLIPPGTVASLLVSATSTHSVTLTWRAPGNDGATGRATEYDLRYALTDITEETWAAATGVPGVPAPMSPGTTESFTVDGLATGQTCFFALKTGDEGGNWSEMSNVVSGTAEDVVPPGWVSDLTGCSPGAQSVTVSWTAPGNDGADGRAAEYDLRYSLDFIFETNWDAATRVPNVPAPNEAGTAESFTVTGLEAELTYYFGLKTADETGNWSTRSNVARGTSGTSTLRRLTIGPSQGLGAFQPAWSPDGKKIVFAATWSGGYNDEIYIVPVACGGVVRLTVNPGNDSNPAWSPDGEKIVFASSTYMVNNEALWIMGTTPGSPRVRLTESAGRIPSGCAWSPDGTQIAYDAYNMGPPAVVAIYLVSAQGGTPRKLTDDTSLNSSPTWSPDGTRIAFASNRNGNNQIWVMPAAGGEAVQLTTEPGWSQWPSWSPDGSRIAFSSDRSGGDEIWMMPAEGGEATQLTFGSLSSFGRWGPVWSPDGRQIAFTIYADGANDIWILQVE
jgi:Tol biopolymer transport system component